MIDYSNLTVIIPTRKEQDIHVMMEETEALCPGAQIVVSHDRYGKGKGWCLRQGLKEANGDLICFIDGDKDIHPYYIAKFCEILRNDEHIHVVVGKKTLNYRWDRCLITVGSRLFIGLLFGLWFDTQTGIKVFRRHNLPSWHNDSFAFDVEIMARCKRLGYRVMQYPINVNIRKGMPGRSILRFIRGCLQIKLRFFQDRYIRRVE